MKQSPQTSQDKWRINVDRDLNLGGQSSVGQSRNLLKREGKKSINQSTNQSNEGERIAMTNIK